MPNKPTAPTRALHTTGRIASRMNEAERQKVRDALQAFVAPKVLPADVELELGIGNGEALAERAKAAPARWFIGTDVYLNGMAQAARFAANLPNVTLLAEDARDLLARLPAASVTRLIVPHPDPWPKASHHKRRLVQPAFLVACARVLKPGGELWVVTDWPDYAFHTLSLLYKHPSMRLLQTGETAADCKVRGAGDLNMGPQHLATPPHWWVPTKYQQKAAQLGRAAWFIGAVIK